METNTPLEYIEREHLQHALLRRFRYIHTQVFDKHPDLRVVNVRVLSGDVHTMNFPIRQLHKFNIQLFYHRQYAQSVTIVVMDIVGNDYHIVNADIVSEQFGFAPYWSTQSMIVKNTSLVTQFELEDSVPLN